MTRGDGSAVKRSDRPSGRFGDDVLYRGDRLREEVRRMQARMAQLERLIAEAVRNHR